MMRPTIDDLRVLGTHNHYGDHYRKVDPDELEQMGLVQRPTCTGCGGSGRKWRSINTPMDAHNYPCPKCGGSGYLPMVAVNDDGESCVKCHGTGLEGDDGQQWVALDVDVEALREAWSAILMDDYDSTHVAIVDDAIQVLAALDGETT